MARNGSGTYSNPYSNFVSGTVISSTQVDANNSDIATALTQSIAVDGQSTVTANLPMNAKKFTGLAVGAAATDSLNLGQAQAEAMVWCGTAGGTADAITLSPTPAITAYAAGQRFVWKASGSVNTGATTVAVSGLGAIALQDNGSALAAGQHQANKIFMGILDTTSTVQVTQVQISGTDPLIVTSLTVSGTATVGGILSVDDTTTSTSGTTGSIHTDGGLGVAGTAFVAGAATVGGASQFNSTVTVGVNDTGYDVKLFGATSGKSLLWDESADSLIVTGTTTLVGTTNLDAVDIDGAIQIDGTVTVGVNDTGYDVQFFGATSGAHMLWDESADDLKLVGAAGLTVAGNIDVDGTTNLDAVDIDGAVQIDAAVTVGVDDTGYDVKFFGDTASAYMLWDTSADDLILGGAAKLGIGTSSISGKLSVDGGVYAAAGSASGVAYGFYPAGTYGNTGMFSPAANTVAFATSGGEHMRIASSGLLLINTTANTASTSSPRVQINAGSNSVNTIQGMPCGLLINNTYNGATTGQGISMKFQMSEAEAGKYAAIAGVGDSSYSNSMALAFYTTANATSGADNVTERMRIDSGGNLMVGTTTATGQITTQCANGASAVVTGNISGTSGYNGALFYNNGLASLVGLISVSGSTTSYTSVSDYRLKSAIAPMTGALAKVVLLKPVTYKWNADGSDGQGFIAHELQEVVSDAVSGEKDAVDAEGKPRYQGVDTSFLVATLTAAIQEQQALIEALTTRITALEG
jgi:hypothetical protein